jgi:hypothetical protein
VYTNSPFSHVGLVAKLPNKWTETEELYVVELTRNIDRFLDAFKEIPGKGLCIFRLFERIHHIHVNNVHWIPLKKPLEEMDEEILLKWLAEVHNGKNQGVVLESFLTASNSRITGGIEAIVDKSLAKSADCKEAYSADFIFTALRYVS